MRIVHNVVSLRDLKQWCGGSSTKVTIKRPRATLCSSQPSVHIVEPKIVKQSQPK